MNLEEIDLRENNKENVLITQSGLKGSFEKLILSILYGILMIGTGIGAIAVPKNNGGLIFLTIVLILAFVFSLSRFIPCLVYTIKARKGFIKIFSQQIKINQMATWKNMGTISFAVDKIKDFTRVSRNIKITYTDGDNNTCSVIVVGVIYLEDVMNTLNDLMLSKKNDKDYQAMMDKKNLEIAHTSLKLKQQENEINLMVNKEKNEILKSLANSNHKALSNADGKVKQISHNKTDEIKELYQLYKDGVLTEQEFKNEKQKILSK